MSLLGVVISVCRFTQYNYHAVLCCGSQCICDKQQRKVAKFFYNEENTMYHRSNATLVLTSSLAKSPNTCALLLARLRSTDTHAVNVLLMYGSLHIHNYYSGQI